MTSKIEYVGEANNWMDMRDFFLETLSKCDTELKFNRFLEGIFLSIAVSPEQLQETRKFVGAPELSKKDFKKMKEMFKEDERKK